MSYMVNGGLKSFSKVYISDSAKVRNRKKTWKRKQTSLDALISFMEKWRLQDVSTHLLEMYVKQRLEEGKSAGTINKDLTVLKHLLTYAVMRGVIDSNPIEKFKNLKEDQKERPRFTEQQIQAIIGAARPDCTPIFTFIRETGCRRDEALSLQHWQVQADSQQVVFSHNTKSRRYRYVPLTEVALEAVNALPRVESCPFVFYNLKSKDRWCDCRKPWEQVRKKAGVPELQVKDLRRHFAIKLAESGASMHDIQQVLGHASAVTTEKHYAHFSPEHSSRKILKVLEGGKQTGNKTETTLRVHESRS